MRSYARFLALTAPDARPAILVDDVTGLDADAASERQLRRSRL
jgi:hypothetical protein